MRNILRTHRVLKHRAEVERGLVPADAVVVGAPPADVHRAGRSAVAGDVGPTASLLAGTRERRAWAERSVAVDHLARMVVSTPGWFEEWRDQAPEGPDLLLLAAAAAITRAWEVRSAARAEHVAHDQFQAFHALLADAHPMLVRAIEANPGDPVPWEWALAHVRGTEQPVEVLEECLGGLRAADPGHLRGLHQALLYVAPRWFGSEQALLSLTDQLVADVPPASPARLLPLVAVVELAIEGGSRTWSQDARDRVDEAVREAEAWLDGPGRGHAAEAFGHSALVWVHHLRRRQEDAYRHLQALGERVDSYPWRYFDDQDAHFRSVREGIVVLVASERR